MYNIAQYLKGLGYATVSEDYRKHILQWAEWYRGKVDEFHNYTVWNGIRNVPITRRGLDMAKTICEDWANLLLNERVEIAPEGESVAALLAEQFAANNFSVRANRLVERAFATGTGAFSEYRDGDGVARFDCHDARSIWPLKTSNDEITECAFAAVDYVEGRKCIYLRIYTTNPDGTQKIQNRYLDYESGAPVDAPEGMQPEVDTGIATPLFQIVTPNLSNNIDVSSPLGLSVFANAIDALKGCDLIYDSWCSEYQLGRKRLLIPMSMAQIELTDDSGGMRPIFDVNDTVFYALNSDPNDKTQQPYDHSPDIRAEEHLNGLTANLSVLSMKCGLGANRYGFDRHEGIKTATEVVSEQSDLYQSLCKHELVLTTALRGLARALLALAGVAYDGEIKITFDDSIIQDKNAIRAEARLDVSSGLMSKMRYLTDVVGMSEDDATKELAQIKAESATVTPDDADFATSFSGG